MYTVREIFYTLQGEGARTGRPAVFCRFAGCNLWTGREADRANAVCRFCDTEFVGTDGTSGEIRSYNTNGTLQSQLTGFKGSWNISKIRRPSDLLPAAVDSVFAH